MPTVVRTETIPQASSEPSMSLSRTFRRRDGARSGGREEAGEAPALEGDPSPGVPPSLGDFEIRSYPPSADPEMRASPSSYLCGSRGT